MSRKLKKPNRNASAAKRDQCMNPSLSTQSAFTTKLNVRKGPALLCTAVDHACHSRSSSLVVRINSISNHVLHEAAQEFAGTSRPGALSAPKVDISASTPRRRQKQDLSAPAGMTDRNMLDVVPRTFARSNIP
jgi:hypothetical protein